MRGQDIAVVSNIITSLPRGVHVTKWKVSPLKRVMIYDANKRKFWVISPEGRMGYVKFERSYDVEFEFLDDRDGEYEHQLSSISTISQFQLVEQRRNRVPGFAEARNINSNDDSDDVDVSELNILLTAVDRRHVHFLTLYWHGSLVINEYLRSSQPNVRLYMTPRGFYQTTWRRGSTRITRPDGSWFIIPEAQMFRVSDDYLIGDRLYTLDGDLVYDYEGSLSVWGRYALRYVDEATDRTDVYVVDLATGSVVEELALGERFLDLLAYLPELRLTLVRLERQIVLVGRHYRWTLYDWHDAYATDEIIAYLNETWRVIMQADVTMAN